MNWKEIKILIKEKLEDDLKEINFSLVEFDLGGFYIESIRTNRKYKLGIGKYNIEDGINLSLGGIPSILFNEVEAIVFPLVKKHKLWDNTIEPMTPPQTFADHSSSSLRIEYYNKNIGFAIAHHTDVDKFKDTLFSYLNEYVLPWFKKYSELNNVNELMNNVSMQEILNMFTGPFPTQFFRAIVITEHCNNRQRTLEIKKELLRHFELCKKDTFYTPTVIEKYINSYEVFCRQLKID
jgi:hypothetical protein